MALPTKLSGEWWLKHKGKTVGKTGLSAPLKAYEALRKSAGEKFENQSHDLYKKLAEALKKVNSALPVALKKTDGVTHGASHKMVQRFQELAKEEAKLLVELQKVYTDAIKIFKSGKEAGLAKIVKHEATAKGYLADCKAAFQVVQGNGTKKEKEKAFNEIDDFTRKIAKTFAELKASMKDYDKLQAQDLHHEDLKFTGKHVAQMGDIYSEIMTAERTIQDFRSKANELLKNLP